MLSCAHDEIGPAYNSASEKNLINKHHMLNDTAYLILALILFAPLFYKPDNEKPVGKGSGVAAFSGQEL